MTDSTAYQQMRSLSDDERVPKFMCLLEGNHEVDRKTLVDSGVCELTPSSAEKHLKADYDWKDFKTYSKPTENQGNPNPQVIRQKVIKNLCESIMQDRSQAQISGEGNYLKLNIEKTVLESLKKQREQELSQNKPELEEGAIEQEQGDSQFYLKEILKQLLRILRVKKAVAKEIVSIVIQNRPTAELHAHFQGNEETKTTFLTLLGIMQSFISHKKWGGEDHRIRRKKMAEKLTTILVFSEEDNSQLYEEYMKNPLSLMAANLETLTRQQKKIFLSNQLFKTGGTLQEYNEMLNYSGSIESRSNDQMEKIIAYVEQITGMPVVKLIMTPLKEYDIDQLLKLEVLKPYKSLVYKFIKEECSAYSEAHKKIHIMQKERRHLRKHEEFEQTMLIRSKFMEVGLPFEEWEQVQDALKGQKYYRVDDCHLNNQGKFQLRMFINESLKPYFRSEKNPYSQEARIQLVLKELMLSLSFENQYSYTSLIEINKRILEQEDETGKCCEARFRLNQLDEFKQKLSSCQELTEYFSNKKQNLEEKRFKLAQSLQRQILSLNRRDKMDVSTRIIESFIDATIRSFEFPEDFPDYVCRKSDLTLQANSEKNVDPNPERSIISSDKESDGVVGSHVNSDMAIVYKRQPRAITESSGITNRSAQGPHFEVKEDPKASFLLAFYQRYKDQVQNSAFEAAVSNKENKFEILEALMTSDELTDADNAFARFFTRLNVRKIHEQFRREDVSRLLTASMSEFQALVSETAC